jgi:hypothetical protein
MSEEHLQTCVTGLAWYVLSGGVSLFGYEKIVKHQLEGQTFHALPRECASS